MCDTWNWTDNTCVNLVPANTNFRHFAKNVFDATDCLSEEPYFSIDQEYTFVN